jgi:hypothetical protein
MMTQRTNAPPMRLSRYGPNSAGRLRWLLEEFVYRPLPNEAAIVELSRDLETLVSESSSGLWSIRGAEWVKVGRGLGFNRAKLENARGSLRTAIETIGRPDRWERLPLKAVELSMSFEWDPDGARLFNGGFSTAADEAPLVAMRFLLASTPPRLIRACPYGVPDTPRGITPGTLSAKAEPDQGCGRVFVAVKRQKWCPDHQQVVRREQIRLAQEEARHRRRLTAGKQADGRRKRGAR